MNITKKTLLIVLFIATLLQTKAQEKLSTYKNSLTGKTFDIKISSNEKKNFTLWIDANSLDDLHKEGGISIAEEDYLNFLTALDDAKLKFEEWQNVAKENNLVKFEKTMSIKCKADAYFKYGTSWNFHFFLKLGFEYRVWDFQGNVKHLLVVRTGELQSSTNKYMKVDGFVLVFYNLSDIESFKKAISKEAISNFLSKPKKTDLFKD